MELEEFDTYVVAVELQQYPKAWRPYTIVRKVVNATDAGGLPEVPVWSSSKPVVRDPPPRYSFIAAVYGPPTTPFVPSPLRKRGDSEANVYSVTVSSCQKRRVALTYDGAVCDMVGNEVKDGDERANDAAEAEHDGDEEDERTNEADYAGYEGDDEEEHRSDASCRRYRGGEEQEGRIVGVNQVKARHKAVQNVYDVVDDVTHESIDGNEIERSSYLLEDEAEEVDDAELEVEEEPVPMENIGSGEYDGSEETLWQSDATNDDPRDEDYNPDTASDPPTDDDHGVPLMVLDYGSSGADVMSD